MTQPNIILVIIDDASFDLIRALPQVFKRLTTTGVQFLNANVGTSLCEPARATFITGQYSHNHGVTDNGTGYTSLDQTNCLQRRLQAVGYKTCHVGKYLNSYVTSDTQPTGWDDWHGIWPQTYYSYNINDNGVVTAKGTTTQDYYTSVVENRTNTFIAAQASTSQPFFMMIGHKAPHFDSTVYVSVPDPSHTGVIPSSRNFPTDGLNFNPASMPNKPSYIGDLPIIDGSTLTSINSFWRGQMEMLFSVNTAIESMMVALSTVGKSNTVVILTSDNGYMHGEFRDPNQKYVPYEASIRIPLIISGPSDLVAQSKVCSQLVSHVDICPTIYALSGATTVRALDGLSLDTLLLDPLTEDGLRTELLIEWLGTSSTPVYYTVKTKRYKYTEYTSTGEKELYNIVNDPWEMTNLADTSPWSQVQNELATSLTSLKSCRGTSCHV